MKLSYIATLVNVERTPVLQLGPFNTLKAATRAADTLTFAGRKRRRVMLVANYGYRADVAEVLAKAIVFTRFNTVRREG